MRKFLILSIILILSFLLVSFTCAGLNGFWGVTIQNQGQVASVNISVYKDSGCVENLTSIDWGQIKVGETKTYQAWVRNEGTLPVTLTMNVNNWVPSVASSALSLTWNSESVQVEVGEIKPVVFSLKALNVGVTNFAFDIIVVGVEA